MFSRRQSSSRRTPFAFMSGRVALVTGAASGIGAALTQALLGAGALVHAADLDELALRERHGTLPRLTLRPHDVRDRADAHALVREVVAQHGRLDLAVHNAGVVGGGPFEAFEGSTSDRILDVNLRGVLHGTEAAYREMVRQGGGQIINLSSMAGLHAVPYSSVYAASKHAVLGLSLSLREEGRRHGVRVGVACPGLIDTAIFRSATDAAGYGYREVVARVPGRKLTPAQAAEAILRGAERNDAIITFPRSSRALQLATRVAPGLLRRAIGSSMKP